jgi:hypothetical protein
MKKFTFLIAVTFMSMPSFGQILNQGFETWVPNNETGHTYQMPQRWVTTDVLRTFVNELFGNPGYVSNTVSQTTGHSGNYATRMSVGTSTDGDTVAGTIFYCDSATTLVEAAFGANITPGFPCSTRPANFTGWYTWSRIGGDSAAINILFTKWNPSTQTRDSVAFETLYILSPVASWTMFSIPISYSLNVYPDTVFIGAGNSTGTPHIGSVFTVDDFAFSGTVPIGINEGAAENSFVSVFPNPFAEQTTLTIKDVQISKGKLEIYDVLGNKVRSMENLSGNTFIISREGLPAGIYFYTLSQENELLATGKINCQ